MAAQPWIPTQEELEKAEKLAAQGMDEQDIATCLGIHPATLSKKKGEISDLNQAIRRGKAKGIDLVTEALLDNVKNKNVTAQIFYLKCKANWRDQKSEDLLRLEDLFYNRLIPLFAKDNNFKHLFKDMLDDEAEEIHPESN